MADALVLNLRPDLRHQVVSNHRFEDGKGRPPDMRNEAAEPLETRPHRVLEYEKVAVEGSGQNRGHAQNAGRDVSAHRWF